MEIRTIADLTTRDPTNAVFGPSGLTIADIQAMIAHCDLAAAVPEHVRVHVESCRKLHTYGYFVYEFYTVVGAAGVLHA